MTAAISRSPRLHYTVEPLPSAHSSARWSTFEEERRDALEGVRAALNADHPDTACVVAGLQLLNHLHRLAPHA